MRAIPHDVKLEQLQFLKSSEAVEHVALKSREFQLQAQN